MPSDNIDLKIKGMSDLLRNLDQFPKEVYEEVQGHIQTAAQKILNDAKSKTPVHTGYLRDHYSVEVEGAISRQMVTARVVNNSPHAHLIEFGHALTTNNKGRGKGRFIKIVPGQPFIRPALEAASGEAIEELVQGVNAALEKMESKAK